MVFLAITPKGFAESMRIAAGLEAVWCSADAITEAEFDASNGTNVTRFIYTLGDANHDEIAEAVATIKEHHPGQLVWVEHV